MVYFSDKKHKEIFSEFIIFIIYIFLSKIISRYTINYFIIYIKIEINKIQNKI